jgi:hypothetical protein
MPKAPEQKIMKLEAQVKLLEKQKAFLVIEPAKYSLQTNLLNSSE